MLTPTPTGDLFQDLRPKNCFGGKMYLRIDCINFRYYPKFKFYTYNKDLENEERLRDCFVSVTVSQL